MVLMQEKTNAPFFPLFRRLIPGAALENPMDRVAPGEHKLQVGP